MISMFPWWIWLGALLLAVPLDRAAGLEPDPSTSDALPKIDWFSEASATSTGKFPPKPTPPRPSKSSVAGKLQRHHPERLVTIPQTTGPIITDDAITQPYKTWSAQITPSFGFVGGVFSSSWKRREVGANQPTRPQQLAARGDYTSLQIPIQFYYGLAPKTEINLTIPFVQNWAANVGPASQAANFGSLGDSNLTAKHMFIKGEPTTTKVTGYFSVQLPTGHANPLEPKLLGLDQTGSGAYAWTYGIDIFKYLPPCLLYGNVFYTNFGDATVNGVRTYYPDVVTGNIAVEIPLKNSPANKWVFLLEVLSTWSGGRMIGHKANQTPQAIISVLPGVEFLPADWFQLALGVEVSLLGKNTQYTYTPTLALFVSF
jgi:hypothetical protein